MSLKTKLQHLEKGSPTSSENESSLVLLPLDHPYINEHDEIDFYFRSHRLLEGALNPLTSSLSWKTMVKKDTFLCCFWWKVFTSPEGREYYSSLYSRSDRRHNLKEISLSNDPGPAPKFLNNHEELTRSRYNHRILKMSDLVVKELDFKDTNSTDARFEFLDATIQNSANPVVAEMEAKMLVPKDYDQMIGLIIKSLPSKKVIWLLVERFFKYCYPFMPYLDEDDFKSKISAIIGKRSMDELKVAQFNITNTSEMISIAILLFVLQLGSFSLINIKQHETDDMTVKYLLRNQLSKANASLALYFFVYFKSFKYVSLEILQLAIYRRLYTKFSPLDGDLADPSGSQIIHGIVLQMAVALGLNREVKLPHLSPDNYDTVNTPENVTDLKRRIWHFIIMNDSYYTYVLTTFPSIKLDFYDTQLPQPPSELNRLSHNFDLEEFIYDYFQQFAKYDKLAKGFVYDVLSSKPSNVKNVLCKVKKLEDVLECDLQGIDNILFSKYESGNRYADSLRKVYSLINYLEMRSLILIVYYHVFIQYELSKRNDELCIYYFEKIILVSSELSEKIPQIFAKSSTYFGDGFDYYLIPTLEITIKNLLKVISCVQLRLKHYQASMGVLLPSDKTKQDTQFLLKDLSCTFLRLFKPFFRIADRYYFSWRMTKLKSILMLLVRDEVNQFEVDSNKQVSMKGARRFKDLAPQESILYRLAEPRIAKFFELLKKTLLYKKLYHNYKPELQNRIESFTSFNSSSDFGNLARNSAERTKLPLTSNNRTFAMKSPNDQFLRPIPMSNASPSSSEGSSFMVDPSIDKLWIEFLSHRNFLELSRSVNKTQAGSFQTQSYATTPNVSTASPDQIPGNTGTDFGVEDPFVDLDITLEDLLVYLGETIDQEISL